MSLKHPTLFRGPGDSRDAMTALRRVGVTGLASMLTPATRDITEEALRDSDFRYQQLFEHMHEGVAVQQIIRDSTGMPIDYRVLDVNPAWEAIMHLRHEDVSGRLASDVFGGTAPFLDVMGSVAMGSRDTVVDVRYEPLDRDLRLSLFTIEADQFATVIQDMTEQRRLEQRFNQSQKMEAIGRLAGGVAHDFNNLLTVILGYADMAIEQLTPSDPLYTSLTEIRASADRAGALTTGLLAFSRKQVVKPRAVDLRALAADMVPMLQRVMGEDIQFETELADGLTILADPHQIEQVIMNLVVNARDAMPRGGRLTLAVEPATITSPVQAAGSGADLSAGTYAVLSVTDTGTGMDGDTLSHLFEPFFTTKPAGKGTGLGLSTVFGIVAQNGGSICVRSEVGSGTTFRVFFPLQDPQATSDALTQESSECRSGREVVLVAEDDESVRRLVTATLSHAGYRVLEAADGVEALRLSQETDAPVDLLVTDAIMPKMGGTELADHIRASCPDTRILFLSGYGDEALQDRHDASHTAALWKPFRPAALLEKVREVLDRSLT
jgi:two-component system, cell cycle sensor histidine kinase and response regulator CckA